MKVTINAIAPTAYQLGSLRRFGMNYSEVGDGSFLSSEDFDSIPEAKEYLRARAKNYYEDPKELKAALSDIRKYGTLTIDDVTAHIEKNKP